MNIKKRATLKYFLSIFVIFSFPNFKLKSKKIFKEKKFSKVWMLSINDS